MSKKVTWAITYTGKITGTAYVTCSEDEHRLAQTCLDRGRCPDDRRNTGATTEVDVLHLAQTLFRAERYEDRYATYAYRGNPDFNYRAFRTTNVLRWEYRPGSALFLVWQQGREDVINDGRFQFGPNFNDLFGAPANNTFLIKFSRWLNF